MAPSTWNSGPRNQNNALGPYEASLVGNEVRRTIHSFDPCLACAIHLHDAAGRPITRVKAL